MRLPHFAFYPRDYMHDVRKAGVSLEAEAIYMRLLCVLWDEPDCSIDPNRIPVACGVNPRTWKKLATQVLPFLEYVGDHVTSKRLRSEWAKAMKVYSSAHRARTTPPVSARIQREFSGNSAGIQAENEKVSAESLGNSDKSRGENQNQNQILLTTLEQPQPSAADSRFEEFWRAYPRKLGKPSAVRRFKALSVADQQSAIAAAKHYAKACAGREPRYVKHGSSFLSPSDAPWRDYVNGPPEKTGPPAQPDTRPRLPTVAELEAKWRSGT